MQDWLDGMAGPGYISAILWTFAALILLVIVLVIVKLARSLTFGTFVAGGRNRKTRLAVMDATAVDSHRRLVLVRRDDIEHLLLIGGPTDVVVERDIRLVPARRPVLTGDAGHQQQPAAAAQAPRPRAPQPAPGAPQRPVPARPQPQPAPAHPAQQATEPAPRPVAAQRASAPASQPYGTNHQPVRPAAPLPPAPATIDDTLLRELEFTLDEDVPAPEQKPASLDDEMTRLLGELSNHKK